MRFGKNKVEKYVKLLTLELLPELCQVMWLLRVTETILFVAINSLEKCPRNRNTHNMLPDDSHCHSEHVPYTPDLRVSICEMGRLVTTVRGSSSTDMLHVYVILAYQMSFTFNC